MNIYHSFQSRYFSLQNIYMKIMMSSKIIRKIRHKFCGSFGSYLFIFALNIALNPMKNGYVFLYIFRSENVTVCFINVIFPTTQFHHIFWWHYETVYSLLGIVPLAGGGSTCLGAGTWTFFSGTGFFGTSGT